MRVIHPRPNPIIAAMYTLRDLDVDVMVIHGPAGCGFMASRMIEEAGIRVVTSGLKDPWWQSITTGAMLCFFILLQSLVLMRRNKRNAKNRK